MAGKSAEYKLAIQIAGTIASSFNSSVGAAQSKLSALGKAAGTAMKAAAAASAAATAAVGAFAASSVKTGMEFDKSMSQVAATMGKTTDEIQELRDFAQEMGRTTAFSAVQSAEGLNILAMSGLDAKEQIAALPQVMNLAAAGALELDSSASYVTGTVKGFRDEMGNAQIYADLMAKGATLANTSVSGLGEAMSRSAANAKTYNQGADSLTLSLLRLAEQNVEGEAASTALNRAMSDLYAPTAAAQKALAGLGLSAYDDTGAARDFNEVVDDLNQRLSSMTDEQKNATLATIFTTQGLNAFNKMVATSPEKLEEFRTGLENSFGSAAQQAATQLDNLAGDITLFKSALEGAQIVLNDQLTPSLREFVQFGSEGLSELTTAFQDGGLDGAMEALGGILSDGLNLIVGQVPGFTDAGMRLLGALGQGLLDNLPTITSAALTVALMLVDGLVTAFPALTQGGTQLILQLALGIADAIPELLPAVLAAVFEIVNTLTGPDTLTALLGAALAILLALGDGLIAAIPDLVAAIPVIVENLVTALVAAAPMLAEAGVHLLGSLASNLPAIVSAVIRAVPAIIAALLGAFFGSDFVDGLAGFFSGAWESATATVPALGAMASGIQTILENIIGFVQNIFTGNWSAAWQNVLGILQGIFTTIASVANLPMQLLLAGVQNGLNAVGAFLQEKVPFLGAIFTGWASSISAAIDNIKAVFSSIIDFIGNIFAGNWSAAWQNIQDIFVNLFGAIANLAKAPINGVISAINFVLEKINGISVTIPDWVPGVGGKTLGFNLPTIPQMAEGGIVTGPTILEAGEAGDEAIIPLPELWSNMQSLMADALGGYSNQLAAITEQLEEANNAGARAMPISDLLGDLVGDDEPPEGNGGDGDGDGGNPGPTGDPPPPLVIYYQPHLHFEGGTPSREDIVEAGRISQEEFNRMAAKWQKDAARLSLKE